MRTSGGPRGGEEIGDVPAGTVLQLDVGDPRGWVAHYEARIVDKGTSEMQAIFLGVMPVTGV